MNITRLATIRSAKNDLAIHGVPADDDVERPNLPGTMRLKCLSLVVPS